MYLRWARITFFLLTTALCITEIGLAAWSLSYGHDKQDLAKHTLPGASLDLSDAFAVGGAVTAAAAVSTLLCLGMLIWTVIKPARAETLRSVRIKEGLFVFVLCFFLGTLIPATYYCATKSGVVTAPGIPSSLISRILKSMGESLAYSAQTPIKSYVIVGWIAFLSTFISLVLVSVAARKTLKYGPDVAGPLEAPLHQDQHAESTIAASSARPSMNEKVAPAAAAPVTEKSAEVPPVEQTKEVPTTTV
ncbi:hypothetical protein JCM10908_007210 [Rhodotorula pacifica]|uniref:uncharacterized protein n=1 Tax=Rhodotorula pacifica TaxID=1495444 RepID=UPI00317854FF